MNDIILSFADEHAIDSIAELIYETESHPNYEWGVGEELDHKNRLRLLLKSENNRFALNNILTLKTNNNFIGFLLFIEGKDIKKLTLNSDKILINFFPTLKEKVAFFFAAIHYMFSKECDKDELYISNIAISSDFRGKNYSNQLIDKALKLARELNYKKVSLHANNDNLVKFYSSLGFQLVNTKTRKMIKYL